MMPSVEPSGTFRGRRDRSYSDAHALLSHKASQHSDDGVMGDANNVKATGKRHRHGHGHMGRQRSKSLDHHHHRHRRHSTPLRKKKFPHSSHHRHKHGTRAHSPLGHHNHYHHPHSTSPQLKGKMWVRPVAAKNQATKPVMPAMPLFNHSMSGSADQERQAEDLGFHSLSVDMEHFSLARQATSSYLPDASSFEDDMLPSDSFEFHRVGGGPGRMTFGESGKPLRPRDAAYCVQYTSAPSTASAAAFPYTSAAVL